MIIMMTVFQRKFNFFHCVFKKSWFRRNLVYRINILSFHYCVILNRCVFLVWDSQELSISFL